jgi:maltose O-acetyltransferase
MEAAPVHIGNDCWIGARAIILAGVQVQDRAVIGAGAVVTRNVEASAIVAGVPAVQIGARGDALNS